MERDKDFVIVPYNSSRLNGKYLVTNVLGAWAVLTEKEFSALNSFRVLPGSSLFNNLRSRGIVVDTENVQEQIQGFRNLNANLFSDTALHIVVVTTGCNLRCRYCQAHAEPEHMNMEVATRVLKSLFDVRNPSVTLEFQGGEPLCNWPVVEAMIKGARKANTTGKNLSIVMVSNLLLLDEEKMRVLSENNVGLCSSLDGPAEIHDQNRVDGSGGGTYAALLNKVQEFRTKFNGTVQFLPTITKASLKYPEAIIDEYVRLGQKDIALRAVNQMGEACCSWENIGYTPEEFCDFYRRGMDYILKLNKQGAHLSERMARVILNKVLLRKDLGYVDMMNPCGAGRAVLAYMPDGSIYPCDEARMIGEDMFRLGNILEEDYADLMKKENLMYLLQSSCTNLWNYSSVYSPWIGFCPVVNYALQQNMVPKIACSAAHKILMFQFEYIFDKLIQDGAEAAILRSWVEGAGNGQE